METKVKIAIEIYLDPEVLKQFARLADNKDCTIESMLEDEVKLSIEHLKAEALFLTT